MSISVESEEIIKGKWGEEVYELFRKHGVLKEGGAKIFGEDIKNKITEENLSPEIMTALNNDLDSLKIYFDWLVNDLEPGEKRQLEKDELISNGITTNGRRRISSAVGKLNNSIKFVFYEK
jgi:hypothetical protein